MLFGRLLPLLVQQNRYRWAEQRIGIPNSPFYVGSPGVQAWDAGPQVLPATRTGGCQADG
ncbi:hypothetical protein [Aeromonas sp. 600774]|uniref:hypothetical protein n=1 Tax=Aeromonas sp. 600774 TaxID=2712032 RepID=UPI003BA30C6E